MERLTQRSNKTIRGCFQGAMFEVGGGVPVLKNCGFQVVDLGGDACNKVQMAIDKLAAYEDIGLEPSDIGHLLSKIAICREKAEAISAGTLPLFLYAFRRTAEELLEAQAELDKYHKAEQEGRLK